MIRKNFLCHSSLAASADDDDDGGDADISLLCVCLSPNLTQLLWEEDGLI